MHFLTLELVKDTLPFGDSEVTGVGTDDNRISITRFGPLLLKEVKKLDKPKR